MSTLTVDMLLASMALVGKAPPATRIFFTDYALEESEERLFPASRHRSERINKKLLKRHGGEFRKVPTVWSINGDIYAHPALRSSIQSLIDAANYGSVDDSLAQPYAVAYNTKRPWVAQ